MVFVEIYVVCVGDDEQGDGALCLIAIIMTRVSVSCLVSQESKGFK